MFTANSQKKGNVIKTWDIIKDILLPMTIAVVLVPDILSISAWSISCIMLKDTVIMNMTGTNNNASVLTPPKDEDPTKNKIDKASEFDETLTNGMFFSLTRWNEYKKLVNNPKKASDNACVDIKNATVIDTIAKTPE